MKEGITGDPEWEKRFSQDSKSLEGDDEEKVIDAYIFNQKEVTKQVIELYPNLSDVDQQTVVHMVCGYRSAPPKDKEGIIQRIKVMMQMEEDQGKRKVLENVMELIMRGEQ